MNRKKPSDFAFYLTNFLTTYLVGELGVSDNTIMSYRDTFSLLLRYCKDCKNIAPERLNIKNISRDLIKDYLTWLEEVRKNSISTRNQRLAAIHSFFGYLQVESPDNILLCQEIIEIDFKKKPTPLVSSLPFEGVRAILSQPDLSTWGGRRDLILLGTLYDLGARVSEIADLTVGDIRLTSPATVTITGKGKKTRVVTLLTGTANLLREYMTERRMSPIYEKGTPLFYNRVGHKLTRAGIGYILNKYVVAARKVFPEYIPDKVTPHTLRHSKAMHLVGVDVNLIYIRDLLGHAHIETTQIYARSSPEVSRKALENAYESALPPDFPSWNEDRDLLVYLQSFGRPTQ